jgi:phosphinothricin acetyltransferase
MPSEPSDAVTIDDATDADVPAIVAIVNDVIASSTAIWAAEPVTVQQRLTWLRDRQAPGRAVIVARRDGQAIGFATYGPFRDFGGYETTVEHSIHVGRDHRGTGVGHLLIQSLIARAREAGMHVIVAGVDADTEGSIRFHRSHGFAEVARMPEVGRKSGRWLDLVLLQLTLTTEA